MKHYPKNITAILAIVAMFFLASCSPDEPTPTPENNQEAITGISLSYVLLQQNGTPTTDTTTITFDANGVATPGILSLNIGKSYLTLITFYDHEKVLNPEIVQEGADHKIFFFPSQDGIIHYEYND